MATAATFDVDPETDTVHVRDLSIHNEDLVAFLEEFDDDRIEEAVTQCLIVGAKTLQLAETAKEMEYVKREFEGMQTEVEGEIEDLEAELERKFGEDGHVPSVLEDYLGDDGRLKSHLEAAFDEDGIFSERLDEELGEDGERIQSALDPDREGTPTYRLKQAITEEIEGIRDKLVADDAQEELRGRTTLKRDDFEEDVMSLLDEWTYGNSSFNYAYTGDAEGELSGRDVGDFVVELGDIEQRIVIEAKSDRSYTEPKIKTEMAEAIENRGADYGIFLSECEEYVPNKIGYLQEFDDFVVVCLSQDEEDEVDPRLFHVGLNWARMRVAQATMETGEEVDPAIVQTKVEHARDAIDRFAAVKRNCTNIRNEANSIESALDEIATDVKEQLADIEVELRKV